MALDLRVMHRFIGALMLLALLGPLWSEDALIVHSGVTGTSMDEATFKDVYLGRKTAWEDGSRVLVCLAKSGASHDAVMRLLDKSTPQFLTSWKKLVFTGKGTMPELLDGDDAVVKFVAQTPGAIGYVDKSKVTGGVTMVMVH